MKRTSNRTPYKLTQDMKRTVCMSVCRSVFFKLTINIKKKFIDFIEMPMNCRNAKNEEKFKSSFV